MPKCWLITGGAISCVAVCLILTSITSDNKQNDISGSRGKRLYDDESYLLRDHGALAHLFYMIYLNCGLLSGEVAIDSLLMDPVPPNHKVVYNGIDATFQRLAAQSKIHNVKEEVVKLLADFKLVMDFDWEWADKEMQEFSKSKKLENFYSLGPNQTYDEDEITTFMNSYLDRWQNIFQSLSRAHILWSCLPKRAESLQLLIEQVNNFLEVKIDSIVQAKRQIQIMHNHFETLLPMMLKIISSIGVRDELNFLKGLGAAVAKKKLDPRKVTESIKTFNYLAKKKSHQFLANVLDENLRAMQFGVSPAKKFLEEFDKLGQRFESIQQEENAVYQVNLVVLSFFNLTVFTKRLEKTLAMTKCMLRAEIDKNIVTLLKSVKPEWEHLLKFLSQPQEFSKVLQMEQLFGNIVSNPKQSFADLKNLRDVVLAVKEFTNTMKNQKFSHQAFKVIQELDMMDPDYDGCTEQKYDDEALDKFHYFEKVIKQELGTAFAICSTSYFNLTEIARRMRLRSSNIFCTELCKRTKDLKLLDVVDGVRYLDKLVTLYRQKSDFAILFRVAQQKRSSESLDFLLFKHYMKNISTLRSNFEAVERLEKKHRNGKWSSLASLRDIYQEALSINGTIDWTTALSLMEIFTEGSNDTDLMLVKMAIRRIEKFHFDVDLAHVAFRKTLKALDELDEPFAGFFEWAELLPVDRWKVVSRYSVSILEVVFWLVVIVGIMILLTKETKSRRREKGSEADVFIPTIEPKEFWPQLFQGSRHPLNQLDEDGNTPLFDAVSERNLQEAEQLLEMGASIDVACGPNCQTPLHEAASNDDLEMVKLLLKGGADPKYLNGGGWLAEELCSENSFIPALFSKYFDLRGRYLVPRVKRQFYVLILEPWKFQKEWVEMLPDRIEVVHGYNEGEHNLDDFTHFAVFSGALGTLRSKNLALNLNKMLAFEILSKPGMIVSLDWLVACLDDPTQVDSDWKFIMTGIQFENKTHYDTITKMKRDVHRKRPLLLHGCNFTILPTANRVMQADREAWIRIIEGFGGTYSLCPCPGDPERTPYHNIIQKEEESEKLNTSIVLYFQDSVLHERWTYPSNNISFFGMGWLVESIVRYSFIPSDHEVLRFETDRESLPVIFEPCAEKIYEGTSED